MTTYDEAVAYIDATPKFTTKNSLEHTKAFLRALGDPQDQMKIIHVAGTNGKGSVCAFCASILQASGRRTGLFTSPHLVKINERFVIDGVRVSDGDFLEAYERVMGCVEDMGGRGYPHPTYFEMLYLIGMLIFQKAGVEYLVLETGLGGRFDATNSVEHPLITVITSISLDHVEYLGDTVEKIAAEKAGIIKRGVPVVYDAQDAGAAEVIAKRAAEMDAPAYPVTPRMYEIIKADDKAIDFCLDSGYYEKSILSVGSVALYQVKNASEAVTAVRLLDAEDSGVSDESIREGISRMRLHGRMETVLPGVIVDGAHNEAGVAEFVETARRLGEKSEVTLLFAAVNDKDYGHMIRTICEGLDFARVIVTEVGGWRKADTCRTASFFRKYGHAPVEEFPDVGEAFKEALSKKGDGILFCVGSLYLAGRIEAILEKES